MAKKISQLTQATQVKSDDVTVIVQDGVTKKLPLNTLVTKQDIENKKVAGLAKLDEIEATYENDTYTPTITVKNKSSVKTGEGDEVDYSANVMDGPAKSAILKGQTLVNVNRSNYTANTNITTDYGQAIEFYDADMLPNTTYTIITYSDNPYECRFSQMYNDREYALGVVKVGTPFVFTTVGNHQGLRSYLKGDELNIPQGTEIKILIIEGDYTNIDIPFFEGMQSVKMPVLTTSNEDGTKTNILTVNEPVELRGIGDVQDTLDGLTGELTQRVDEIVFNGSEDWSNDGSLCFTSINERVMNSSAISNYLKPVEFTDFFSNKNLLGVSCQDWGSTSRIYIKINASYTKEETLQYLQQHPLIIQFKLVTPIIKTVDLMPSGTHPSTTPYCWKNGHIQLSSSGLLPNLEYSVVTSRAGQINQNATMIVKNDKRIFDLEILLAGGLVNTTYQALTLQNQVETGLSKVSLSSETEPDYLLYHMIMKLIEEKAYKLDDLTEKVSVFYLYEKLSDEQFETIYSALYPFVEDEIVEEPVVEELPEVVEDEVIM